MPSRLRLRLLRGQRLEHSPGDHRQRLRKGASDSARDAKKFVTEALGNLKCTLVPGPVVCRFDLVYYGYPAISAALAGVADVSVAMRMDRAVKCAIVVIGADEWTPIKCTNAIWDEDTHTWVFVAEVSEIPFIAFSGRKKAERTPGRLAVRRIPELNPKAT